MEPPPLVSCAETRKEQGKRRWTGHPSDSSLLVLQSAHHGPSLTAAKSYLQLKQVYTTEKAIPVSPLPAIHIT